MRAVRRVSLISNLIADPAARARLLSGDGRPPPANSARKLPLPPPRSMSLADIMVGAARNPDSKAKLASLSLSVRNPRSRSRSPTPSPNPSKSPSIPEEQDPLERYRKLAESRNQLKEESESSDEIHSDDSSIDDDKDSDDSNDSDASEKRRARKKNSRSSSTGSIYDKIKLGIKATRASLTPSPSPTSRSLHPPESNSDPQMSPVSGKISKLLVASIYISETTKMFMDRQIYQK